MYALTKGKHKIMYKYKELIITSILSLIITFLVFENMSWYSFDNIPTKVVLLRLIIAFVLIEAVI